MYLNNKIGIVILNYNDFKTTERLSKLISGYVVIDKIVIVDNLSTDNSFQNLQKLKSKKLEILQSNKNGGYSYGNNYGAFYLIEKYNIDILFIANPDVIFDETFIKIIVEDLLTNKAQLISGVMLNSDGNESEFDYAISSYVEELLNCTILIKNLIKFFKRNKQWRSEGDLIFYERIPGSLFGIKSNIYKKIKGLDDNVFLYCEESILSAKLKKFNYLTAVDKRTSYKHLHSVSINKSLNRIKIIEQFYKSHLYYHKTYNNIGNIKLQIMKLFMFYGVLVRKVIFKILYWVGEK